MIGAAGRKTTQIVVALPGTNIKPAELIRGFFVG